MDWAPVELGLIAFGSGVLGIFLGNLLQPLAQHWGQKLVPNPPKTLTIPEDKLGLVIIENPGMGAGQTPGTLDSDFVAWERRWRYQINAGSAVLVASIEIVIALLASPLVGLSAAQTGAAVTVGLIVAAALQIVRGVRTRNRPPAGPSPG